MTDRTTMKKPLSKTARLRLLRQSSDRIEALTDRLCRCPLQDFDKVQKVLFAEKEAYRILAEGERS